MKKCVYFLVSFISFNSFASPPPYDTNCVELGKRWGWISGYDSKDGNKRTYAKPSVIQKGFTENQTRQTSQLSIWADVDKYVPCLKDSAGFTFQNGRFVIFDMAKFTNFRLNKSRIDCEVTSRQTNDHRLAREYQENAQRRFELEQSGQIAVRDNTRNTQVEQRIYGGLQMQDLRNAEARAQEVMNRIRQNNNLGDLGLENYCTHQLKAGITMDKAQTAQENFATCDQARKSNKTSILNSPLCAGYPKENLSDIKRLRDEMEKLDKERKSPVSQPLFTLNNADNDVYSKFKNNYNKLLAAQSQAQKSMSLAYASSNLLQNSDAVQDLKSVADCGNQDVSDESYLDGLECDAQFKTMTDLKVNFQPSVDALKKLHRDKLITEVNTHAFGEAIKSKWYLLKQNDPLKSKMKHKPKEACLEIADESVCSGKYLEVFKKSVNDAWNYSKPHFLSYATNDVVSYMNDRIEWMKQFCVAIQDQQRNQLIQISPETYRIFEKTFNEMVSGEVSPYLYDENVRLNAKLGKFRNEQGQYCQGFNENENISVTPNLIEAAREDFREAIDDQIELSSDFAKPNRGSHSNNLGAIICDVDRQTKEDYYALNSLYQSHPYLTGQILKGQEVVQGKLYATVICEAKKCDRDLESTNDMALSAAKVGAIALNFVPGIGPALYAGTSGVLGAAKAIRDNVRANRSLSEMQRGIASNGVEQIYDSNVGDVLKQLASDGDVGKLIGEIAVIAAAEYAGFKATHGIMHSLEHAIHARGIHLTKVQHTFVDILVHKAVMKSGSLTAGAIGDVITSMSGEKISPEGHKPH